MRGPSTANSSLGTSSLYEQFDCSDFQWSLTAVSDDVWVVVAEGGVVTSDPTGEAEACGR